VSLSTLLLVGTPLVETPTIPFPSPQPSPLGRGRIVLQSSANPKSLFVSRAGLRVSLSPRERAGVRGKQPSKDESRRIRPDSLAFCARILLGVFSASKSNPAWVFLLLLAIGSCSAAEVMPAKPARYFNDYAQVVPVDTANNLNKTLEDFEKTTSSQVVVAVFPKMQSDSSLEDYTRRIAENWKVGQADKRNGAVLFVFVQDRRLRIEVGYGIEGSLPDALAKRIIEDEIKPHFRRGNYEGGLTAGTTAILQAIRGEYKGTGRTVNQRRVQHLVSSPGLIFFGGIFLILLMGVMRMRRKGTVYRGSRRSNWGGWSTGGWGGGWSGGSGSGSGGGFSGGGFSGGGGSFGGGGASGSW